MKACGPVIERWIKETDVAWFEAHIKRGHAPRGRTISHISQHLKSIGMARKVSTIEGALRQEWVRYAKHTYSHGCYHRVNAAALRDIEHKFYGERNKVLKRLKARLEYYGQDVEVSWWDSSIPRPTVNKLRMDVLLTILDAADGRR